MKKTAAIFAAFFLASSLLFAQEESAQEKFVIKSVQIEAKGGTKESALRKKITAKEGMEFESRAALDAFVVSEKQSLINSRLFESAEIAVQESGEGANGERLVDISVQTVDTGHLMLLPYYKYSSNDGHTVKVKLKDDNFMGLMSEFSADAFVQYEKKEGRFSFALPFENFSLCLDLTQGFVRDADYKVFGDELYWVENAKAYAPIILERFNKIGNLVYTPAVEFDYKWNLDGINDIDEDLISPRLIFSHGLGLGKVNWIGNFRKGFDKDQNAFNNCADSKCFPNTNPTQIQNTKNN